MRGKKATVLLVDIGNTSTALGIGRGTRIVNVQWIDTRTCTRKALAEAVAKVCGTAPPSGAAVCSVVPRLNRVFIDVIRTTCKVDALLVTHRLELGVSINYRKPESIGADRLANAAGAVAKYGCPVIIADFGTALTFDVVSQKGAYVGGVIAPGIPLMTDYLADRTALLPRISPKGAHGVIGRSTAEAMRIGAKLGYRGMVREIVEHICSLTDMKHAGLCATGGYARWVLGDMDMPFKFDPTLTLAGLLRIYGLNC